MGLRARLSESQEWGILSGFVQLRHPGTLIVVIYHLPVRNYGRVVRIPTIAGGNSL